MIGSDYFMAKVFNTDQIEEIITKVKSEMDEQKTKFFTTTLTSAGWTGDAAPYQQTVSVSGITEKDKPIVDVVLSDVTETAITEQKEWGKVARIKTADNSITAIALEEKPTVNLNIQLQVVY